MQKVWAAAAVLPAGSDGKMQLALILNSPHNSSTPSLGEAPEEPPNRPMSSQPRCRRRSGSTAQISCLGGTRVTQVSHQKWSPSATLCPTMLNMGMFHSEANRPIILKGNGREPPHSRASARPHFMHNVCRERRFRDSVGLFCSCPFGMCTTMSSI